MKEFTVRDVKLYYEDQGEGNLAVVLLHAFPLNSTMWQPQIAELSEEVRLITPDIRGFGQSKAFPGTHTMALLADDLAALLDHLGLQKVVVGGLSMGGYITFAFWRYHAARVQALVLADTRATNDTAEAREARSANAQLVQEKGAGFIADQMLPNLLAPSASLELQATVRAMIEANEPSRIAGALYAMAYRLDSTDLLSQINVPTLLLVGEQDKLTTPDEMKQIQQNIAGSTLVEIPSAGHISNMENPAAFTAALRDFLINVAG